LTATTGVTEGGAWAGCGPGEPPGRAASALGAEDWRCRGRGCSIGIGGGGLARVTSTRRWMTSADRVASMRSPRRSTSPNIAWTRTTAASA